MIYNWYMMFGWWLGVYTCLDYLIWGGRVRERRRERVERESERERERETTLYKGISTIPSWNLYQPASRRGLQMVLNTAQMIFRDFFGNTCKTWHEGNIDNMFFFLTMLYSFPCVAKKHKLRSTFDKVPTYSIEYLRYVCKPLMLAGPKGYHQECNQHLLWWL